MENPKDTIHSIIANMEESLEHAKLIKRRLHEMHPNNPDYDATCKAMYFVLTGKFRQPMNEAAGEFKRNNPWLDHKAFNQIMEP